MKGKQTRREFLQMAGAAAGAYAAISGESFAKSCDKPCSKAKFELGLASYTFRKFTLEETLARAAELELRYIALKSFHLPLESTQGEIEAAAAKVKNAGLILYGGGVIYMNDEAEVGRAFEYAKQAGMSTIIGVPKHELLPLVEKKIQEYDIKVAIHNHGPGDKLYPTPASVYEKIKGMDSRLGLCIDIGHTQRSGEDPSADAERFADRLLDIHIKDVSESTGDGTTVEMGRGVIDIPRFIRTLVKIGYAGIASFEYEKGEDDPMAGLAESVGYARGVLAAIKG